jgi:purine-binding chemotaxis protein CheW
MIPGHAEDLRLAFDRSFAKPRDPPPEPGRDLLVIRLAQASYAMPLAGLAGVFHDRQVTSLPGAAPGLLGIAGFRGALVPVYDLRALLGLAAGPAGQWLALATGAGQGSIALAFDQLLGHLRMPRSAFAPRDGGTDGRIREVVRTATGPIPVVEPSALVAAITDRLPPLSPARNPRP